MRTKPRVGMTGEVRFTVEPSVTIDFAGHGLPAVLATPHLIQFLEQAGREALRPVIEEGETSLGVEVEIRHLAPTPLGQTVTCTARIIKVEGALVDFQVEARDEVELIARGLHKRAIVRVDRFAAGVARKAAARPN